MRVWPAVVLLLGTSWVAPLLGSRPRPPCPRARFVVDTGSALPGAVELYDGTLAVGATCPPVDAQVVRQQRSGTTVRAAWKACGELNRLHLRGRIDASCRTLRGVVQAGSRREHFRAHRVPACGDGRREGRETCDDGNTLDGDCCTATCQRETTDACRV